jgi:hypothetical protein
VVLQALRDEDPVPALMALRDSPRAERLLTQLFVVALRRCFAGRDVREITRYVRDLLDWRAMPTRRELARQAEALIRAALGEPALAGAVPAARRHEIMCYVVGDLARPPGVPPELLESLVKQAEQRVDRYPPPAGMNGRRRAAERTARYERVRRPVRFGRPR